MWKEYLFQKFSNESLYSFTIESNNYLRVLCKNVGTLIEIYCSDGFSSINSVNYGNSQGYGVIGEFEFDEGTYNLENTKMLDDILRVPLESGWTDVAYFISGKHYRSLIYYGLGKERDEKPSYRFYSSNYGLLSLLLFPIFVLINFSQDILPLVRKEVIEIYPATNVTSVVDIV